MTSSIERLEGATNKVGKALGELLGVVEKSGQDLSEAQVDKVFQFLATSVTGMHQKAQLARSVAVAANGAFKLDMELPESQSALTIPARMPIDPSMGGRLVGARKSKQKDPFGDPDASDFFDE